MIDKRSRLPQLDLPNPIKRPIPPRYALTVNGNTYTWSGRGRLPPVFDDYLHQKQHKGNREQLLKGLLIQGEVTAWVI